MMQSRTTLFFVCFLAFHAVSGASHADDAGDWRIYTKEKNGNVHFFDASRVELNSDVHTVWTRIRYKRNVMAAASYQSLLEIDCSERTERTLQRTFFSDGDWKQPAMKTDTKPKKKRPIKKGSAFEHLSEILCRP